MDLMSVQQEGCEVLEKTERVEKDTVFPQSRVKKIMKADRDVGLCATDAPYAVALVTVRSVCGHDGCRSCLCSTLRGRVRRVRARSSAR